LAQFRKTSKLTRILGQNKQSLISTTAVDLLFKRIPKYPSGAFPAQKSFYGGNIQFAARELSLEINNPKTGQEIPAKLLFVFQLFRIRFIAKIATTTGGKYGQVSGIVSFKLQVSCF